MLDSTGGNSISMKLGKPESLRIRRISSNDKILYGTFPNTDLEFASLEVNESYLKGASRRSLGIKSAGFSIPFIV